MAFRNSYGALHHPILQVVRASSDSVVSLNTNTWGSNPVGTVNITPQHSDNLIMIFYTAAISFNSGNDIVIRLLRNGSEVQSASNGRNIHGAMQASTGAANWFGANATCTFWDEPGTTSQVGYQVQHRPQTGGGGTMYFNATGATSGGDSWGCRSFLTLMEVSNT